MFWCSSHRKPEIGNPKMPAALQRLQLLRGVLLLFLWRINWFTENSCILDQFRCDLQFYKVMSTPSVEDGRCEPEEFHIYSLESRQQQFTLMDSPAAVNGQHHMWFRQPTRAVGRKGKNLLRYLLGSFAVDEAKWTKYVTHAQSFRDQEYIK